MYSLDEARQELEEEKEEAGPDVVHGLDEDRPIPSIEQKRSKSSAIFQKLFSSTANGPKPSVEGKEAIAEEQVGGDDAAALPAEAHRGKHHKHKPVEYPKMPYLGEPVNFARLRSRNEHAQETTEALLALAAADVADSLRRAKSAPVHEDAQRAFVTPEISQMMSKVRTREGITAQMQHSTSEIQRALVYRKAALTTMNANYSDVLVRRVDPIYAHESRTAIIHKNAL